MEILHCCIPAYIEPRLYQCLIQKVPVDTQVRVNRFKFKEDGYRTLIGELLVRFYCNTRLGLSMDSVALMKGSYGKPYLSDIPIEFNISHSGEWVVAAFSNKPVGIDIEKIRTADMGVAQRFFSESENNMLNQYVGNEMDNQFYKLWSLKESYIKALGCGLSKPLNSFTIGALNVPDRYCIKEDDRYYLKNMDFHYLYQLSVCFQEDLSNIRRCAVDISQLAGFK